MERELKFSCYIDAGYLTDANDLKSKTGYVFILNRGVVNWKSTKQSIFATSSTDVEYIVAFDASKEAVWTCKLISGLDLKASGSVEDLELIQEEDTNPSLDTSLDHEEDDQEIDEPQSDINPILKSSRTRRAPDRMCLYIDAEEYELRDLGEPANYKVALLDLESKKWLNAMNVKMQSIKDNEV
nr:hypothetical protein [Tanacetum cinerariifolium]